jgi:hypothetical protein
MANVLMLAANEERFTGPFAIVTFPPERGLRVAVRSIPAALSREALAPAERRAFDAICLGDATGDGAAAVVLESLADRGMVLADPYRVPFGTPMHIAWASLCDIEPAVDH